MCVRPWTQLKASSSVSSISTLVSFFSLRKERTPCFNLSCFYKEVIHCMSHWEEDSRGRFSDRLWDLFQVFFPERFRTPSSWSIICSSSVWSSALSGATEMSLTARNSPQLFRCSFSRRKKFHTKRLRGIEGDSIDRCLDGWQCEEWGTLKGELNWNGLITCLKLSNTAYRPQESCKGIPHSTCWGPIMTGGSFVGDLWLRIASNWDPPEDLKRSQHRGYDVSNRVDLGHRAEWDLDRPGKTQDHVFKDGAVVISLNIDETGSGSLYVCTRVCACVCMCSHPTLCGYTISSLRKVFSPAPESNSPQSMRRSQMRVYRELIVENTISR